MIDKVAVIYYHNATLNIPFTQKEIIKLTIHIQ